MLSKSDMDTVRAVVDVVLDHTNASGAACDIIDGVLSMVVVDHEYVEQVIRDKNAAEAHMYRALCLASEDMARLVGPCTGEPPTLDKVPAPATDPGEEREAASSWYADWLERAEEEATPDA